MKRSDRDLLLSERTRHATDPALYRDEPEMSPAELKCAREYLGLTTRWLSMRWGVSEYSVQRWERDRTPPPDIAHWIRDLRRQFDDQVETDVLAAEKTLTVPRTDEESPSLLPAATFRRMAALTAARTGARIEYRP